MLQSDDAEEEKNPDFKWGPRIAVGRTNKNVHFYESFTYEGTEYRLFDCAFFLVYGHCETSIGKLVKMFETSEGEKKVKVVWFLRPIDIHKFLGEYEPQWDELFLACGDEKGVYNINDVEAILGKCNVICVSSDPRNPRPAKNELRRSNYFFSCTFDTKLKIISEDIPDAIGGIGVQSFFNRIREKQLLKGLNSSAAASSRASPMTSHSESESTNVRIKFNRDGNPMSRTSLIKKGLVRENRADHEYVKKNPLVSSDITSRVLKIGKRAFGDFFASGSSNDSKPSKERKDILNTPRTDDMGHQPGEEKFIKNSPLVEKAPRQNIDENSWYKKLVSSLTPPRWIFL